MDNGPTFHTTNDRNQQALTNLMDILANCKYATKEPKEWIFSKIAKKGPKEKESQSSPLKWRGSNSFIFCGI